MLNRLIRRYQQPLLIAFTVVIIISFVIFFNGGRFMDKAGASHAAGKIYGQTVTQVQKFREGQKFELARSLGMQEMWVALAGQAASLDEAKDNFAWNTLVLRHEAGRLGIEASDDEVLAAIQAMPVFETNGAFDPARYAMIFENALQPRGLGKDQLEELVRDDLRLKKIKALLATTAAPAASEVRAIYDQGAQKVEASVIRLALADFLATATAPEDEVKKLYEDRKSLLKSDEKRKVKVAGFILPTTDKPLEAKQRAEELAKLGRKAEDFLAATAEKDADFDTAAAKVGVTPAESPEFSRGETPSALGDSPLVVVAAFKLTPKVPVSDIVTTDRGYYVLRLSTIIEARPLTYEEAQPKLAEQIKQDRAKEALDLKAREIRNKIEADIKAGKSFADAAQAAGVKVEPVGAFSRAEPKNDMPDAGVVMGTAFDMKEGELSEFVPTATGGDLIHVDKRPPVDDSRFAAQKEFLASQLERFSAEVLFSEWLKLSRAEAHIMTPRQG